MLLFLSNGNIVERQLHEHKSTPMTGEKETCMETQKRKILGKGNDTYGCTDQLIQYHNSRREQYL